MRKSFLERNYENRTSVICGTMLTLLLRCMYGECRPSPDLLRPLLCRECKRNDMFTVSLLKFWAQEYSDKLAELLHLQLTRSSGTPKRKGHRFVIVEVWCPFVLCILCAWYWMAVWCERIF